MNIKTTGTYTTALNNLLEQQPDLAEAVRTALHRFQKNPHDTRLAVHTLKRSMLEKHAFSVTDDIRIIFEQTGLHEVRLLTIGPHATVYPGYR